MSNSGSGLPIFGGSMTTIPIGSVMALNDNAQGLKRVEFDEAGLVVQFENNTLKYLGNLEAPVPGNINWTFDIELTTRTLESGERERPAWVWWGKPPEVVVEKVTTHRVTGMHIWRYTDTGFKCHPDLGTAMQQLLEIIEHRIRRQGKINKPGMGALADLDSEL